MTNGFQLIDGVLSIEPGISYIKSQRFSQNPEIRKVIVPAGVGFMEDEAFAECENLEEVILPEGLTNISVAAFASCGKLSRINIPSTVKSIEDGAFLDCLSLNRIFLPDGLEDISPLAFQSSGLERVCIPASVRRIGEEAFFECEKLRHADVLGKDTAIELNAFGSNYNLLSGFIAPGYPLEKSRSAELLYTLLWCSCPESHSIETSRRAERFIKEQEALIMEKVLKTNNIPAMNGLAQKQLLAAESIDGYLRTALNLKLTEISALLLKAKEKAGPTEGDFEL